jgi:hypothetical protein
VPAGLAAGLIVTLSECCCPVTTWLNLAGLSNRVVCRRASGRSAPGQIQLTVVKQPQMT